MSANFHCLNTPTRANFKLPTSLDMEWERDVHTRLHKPMEASSSNHYQSHQKSSILNPSLGKTPHVSAKAIIFTNKCPGKDTGKRSIDIRVSTTLDLRSVFSWVLVSDHRWRKSHWKGNNKNDGRRHRTGMFYTCQ